MKARNKRTLDIIREGSAAAWPICLGYFPIGLAFGVVAQKTGLSPAEIGLMSLLVFAGSSQFIAVSLLGSGAGFTAIVVTTFIVNLRHLLMSSALAVHLRRVTPSWISLFGYGVTDESFALNMARFRSPHPGENWDWRRALVVNHTSNVAWVISTVVGGYGGAFIPRGSFGIDYALVAMLLCLLVFQLRGALYVLIAAISGITAVILSLVIPGNSHVVLASVIAATLGYLLSRKRTSPRKPQENS
jgi:4-azaleucine resistance transporter AzlC